MVLLLVAYGNRDSNFYLMRKSLDEAFVANTRDDFISLQTVCSVKIDLFVNYFGQSSRSFGTWPCFRWTGLCDFSHKSAASILYDWLSKYCLMGKMFEECSMLIDSHFSGNDVITRSSKARPICHQNTNFKCSQENQKYDRFQIRFKGIHFRKTILQDYKQNLVLVKTLIMWNMSELFIKSFCYTEVQTQSHKWVNQ